MIKKMKQFESKLLLLPILMRKARGTTYSVSRPVLTAKKVQPFSFAYCISHLCDSSDYFEKKEWRVVCSAAKRAM